MRFEMKKFRFILAALIATSLFTTLYLIFVYGTTINFSYLGPNAEYPHRWTGGLLAGSIVLALAGLTTLYFTFFEFHEDENGRLWFSNPDNLLLKLVLKDKLAKPISSCSLFWNVAIHALYLLAAISMPIYFVSVIDYIKHEGLGLQSFVALSMGIWLPTMILHEFFGRFWFISKLSSSSWLNKIWLALFVVMAVAVIISNPMVVIYALLAFLGGGAMVFVSFWLYRKSSKNSLFGRNIKSSKEGHCPIIYPKDNGDNDVSRAVR